MVLDRARRVGLVVLVAVAAGGVGWGLTAANTVPATHAGRIVDTITPDKLKPAACSSITITALVRGSGTVAGTAANELILGSSGADTLGKASSGGSDCCLGGGGTNTYLASCTVHIP